MAANTTPRSAGGVHFHMIVNYARCTYFEKDCSSFVLAAVIQKYIVNNKRRGSFTENGSADGCEISNEAISLYQGRKIRILAADPSAIEGSIIYYLVMSYLGRA